MEKFVILIVMVFSLSACTGTEVTIRPDPSTVDSNFRSNCGSIAIKESPSAQVYPAAGTLIPDFAKAVDRSGLSEHLFYPTRQDDKVDITLDTKFDVIAEHNMGSTFAKSFVTGLSLFVLEPFFWYNHEYYITSRVDIVKNDKIVKTIDQRTEAEMSLKWLSLASTQTLEVDTLTRLKSMAYKQILSELNLYCRKP